MASRHVTGPRAHVEAYERLCRKAAGLPWRGVNVGGGRHVEIADTPFNAHGRRQPGWTTAWATIQEHPKQLNLCACPVFVGAPSKKLSAAEVQALGDAEAAAVELDETWVPKEAEGLPR